MKKTVLKKLFGSILAGSLLASGIAGGAWAQQAGTLNIHWYPGLLGANFKKSFLDTYDQKQNAKVVESFDNARFTQFQASRAKPTSDVGAFTDVLIPLLSKSKLVAPLDVKAVPNLASVDPATRIAGDAAVPVTYGSWGIVYNTKYVKTPVTSWGDMLREDLKGHVSSPNITYNSSVYTLDAYAALKGGSLRNPEAGYDMTRKIRLSGPGLWDQESIAVGWLKTGEIWATPYFSGNVLALMKDPDLADLRFVVPTEGAYYLPLNVVKIANGPSPQGADRFINHMLSVPAQEAWAKIGGGRPVNVNAKVPEDVLATVPQANKLRRVDWDYFTEKRSEIVDRWNETVNK